MRIGIPREIKHGDNRVSCTPAGVRTLVQAGHEVLVETNAGAGSGYGDKQYLEAGATIASSAAEAWSSDMVIKVKEPGTSEYEFLRSELILFTFLHLASDRALTFRLLDSGTTGIAYETVQAGRRLPLLEPMSEIAGSMSAVTGAHFLSRAQGGKGILLGGVTGVPRGKVIIIGGGTAGINAARIAAGIGADVTILDIDPEKVRARDISNPPSVRVIQSTERIIADLLPTADLLICAALVPGAKTPRLITRKMLSAMNPGSVLVDIAIDQGGCAETSRPTTHDNPVFVEENIIHYCVANMPGAVARTSTYALNNTTLAYGLAIANKGLEEALVGDKPLQLGVNTYRGACVHPAVAQSLELEYKKITESM